MTKRGIYVFSRLSISTRLTVWYGLALVTLLFLMGVGVYTGIHLSLHADFEAQLEADEALILSRVQVVDGLPELEWESLPRSLPIRIDGPLGTYVRVLGTSAEPLGTSPNFEEHPDWIPTLPLQAQAGAPATDWVGLPARTRYAPIEDGEGAVVGTLEVTRLESELHRELHRLRWILAIGGLIGAALAIASGYALAKQALLPVSLIAAAARHIDPGLSGQRIPTEFGAHDELSDLASTLNELLERLDASFERERRFRADAAHEMFTPISAMRSEIDVTLRHPRDGSGYVGTLRTLDEHLMRLSRIVDDLLHLARAESDTTPARVPADLREVTREVLDRLRGPAEAGGVILSLQSCEPGCQVPIDAVHLAVVVENLVDNALKYTPSGGTASVGIGAERDQVILRVRDTGVGFSPEEAERVFDRFYRSGRGTARGNGLGLSIAKAIVTAHGGSIEAFSSGANMGAEFLVRLPAVLDSD